MTLVDALKWKRVLWFLSLDLWNPFSRALWIEPEEAESLRYAVRKGINLARSLPGANSDSRDWVYDVLNAVKISCAYKTYILLLDWQKNVFADGGTDRLSELWWIWLCRSIARPEQEMWFSLEIHNAISSCCDLMNNDSASLSALGQGAISSSTEWDKEAIAREESSAEQVMEIVRLIAGRNSFCEAWQATCSVGGRTFLHEVFERVQVFLEEGNSGLHMASGELPFPSSWECYYLKFNPD